MKKKSAYILTALLAGSLVACQQEPVFQIEGEVSGAADKTLYLEQSGLEGIVSLDSVKLDEDGSFRFTGARPASPEFYRLRVDDKVINFSVDSTEVLKLHAGYDNFPTGYRRLRE